MIPTKRTWNTETTAKVLKLVDDYLEKHGTAESIGQSDEAIIDALVLAENLSDAVETTYLEEGE